MAKTVKPKITVEDIRWTSNLATKTGFEDGVVRSSWLQTHIALDIQRQLRSAGIEADLSAPIFSGEPLERVKLEFSGKENLRRFSGAFAPAKVDGISAAVQIARKTPVRIADLEKRATDDLNRSAAHPSEDLAFLRDFQQMFKIPYSPALGRIALHTYIDSLEEKERRKDQAQHKRIDNLSDHEVTYNMYPLIRAFLQDKNGISAPVIRRIQKQASALLRKEKRLHIPVENIEEYDPQYWTELRFAAEITLEDAVADAAGKKSIDYTENNIKAIINEKFAKHVDGLPCTPENLAAHLDDQKYDISPRAAIKKLLGPGF